ncbi:hypothetical protein [Rhizobium mongolense]|uniref:hypothetical protein n=1 Tax=Rhizobium mongolense TaxID=57676 RepID=UPI0034A4ED90
MQPDNASEAIKIVRRIPIPVGLQMFCRVTAQRFRVARLWCKKKMVLCFMRESISSTGMQKKGGRHDEAGRQRRSGSRAQAQARRKPACDPETFVPVAKPEIGAHIIYIVGHGWAAGE